MTITYSPAVATEPEALPAIPPPAWWPAEKPHMSCCDGDHDANPHHDDAVCWGPFWEMPTSLPTRDNGAPCLQLMVSQHVEDDAPKCWVGVGESAHGRHLTAAELRKLATVLVEAAGVMDGGGR